MVKEMKLIIQSKQNYGTHTETYDEEFTCAIEKTEKGLKILFDNGFIQLEEDRIIYERSENKIVIEPNKINACDYETEYGMFVLDIKGIAVENLLEDLEEMNGLKILVAKAYYEIQMVGIEAYENEIEIYLKY